MFAGTLSCLSEMKKKYTPTWKCFIYFDVYASFARYFTIICWLYLVIVICFFLLSARHSVAKPQVQQLAAGKASAKAQAAKPQQQQQVAAAYWFIILHFHQSVTHSLFCDVPSRHLCEGTKFLRAPCAPFHIVCEPVFARQPIVVSSLAHMLIEWWIQGCLTISQVDSIRDTAGSQAGYKWGLSIDTVGS